MTPPTNSGTTGIGLAPPRNQPPSTSPIVTPATNTGTTGIGLATPNTGSAGIGLTAPSTATGEVFGGAPAGDTYGGEAPTDLNQSGTYQGDTFQGDTFQGDTYQGPMAGSFIQDDEPAEGSMQRAMWWSLAMGTVCAIVWFLIAKATGMEFGFAAIGLGLGVGYATARGAGRGGGDVAALAVLVTLFSIIGGEYLVFRHVVMAEWGLDLDAIEQEMQEYQDRIDSVPRDGDYTDREVALLMGYTEDEYYELDREELGWMREAVEEEDRLREQFGVDDDLEEFDVDDMAGVATSAATLIGFFLWLVFSFKHLLFIGIGCYNALHVGLRG